MPVKDKIMQFSNRIGSFDWLNLWMFIPESSIPAQSRGIHNELISLINDLWPGDLIQQSDRINLSKLMVVEGRGYGDLNELGGHAENLGGLATIYIYFGFL